MSPRDNRNGWLAGVPLLLIACLIPPFVLFAPVALAFAALARPRVRAMGRGLRRRPTT